MTDEEKKKAEDELFEQVVKGLTEDIKIAKKENLKTKKMQDFIVEKISVEIAFKGRRPTLDWVDEGIRHYVLQGIKISRNDVLTKLTAEMTRLRKINGPEEIGKILKKYEEHEKEVLNLITSSIIMKPRF